MASHTDRNGEEGRNAGGSIEEEGGRRRDGPGPRPVAGGGAGVMVGRCRRGLERMPSMSQHVRGDGPAKRSARRPAPLLIAGLLLIALGPAGCVGPRGLELTRLRYDQAVHETTEQQWLRNLEDCRRPARKT